ncbi:MAG: hypothetical protein ACW98I_20475 [Candidatus Hodarchaeales archaeon]|jgi:hypothetical protein
MISTFAQKFRTVIHHFFLTFGRIFSTRTLVEIMQRKFTKKKYFSFNGAKFEYFYHSYNNQRLTERTIEIPLIKNYWKIFNPKRVLEIGNVTNHYYTEFSEFFTPKIVVDKYEKAIGVINEDINSFSSESQFDLVFSISTFEHLDSDRGRNPSYNKGGSKLSSYAADALAHITNNLLGEGGQFIITAPLGYSEEFDQTVLPQKLEEILNVKKIEYYYMKKISEIEWEQTSHNDSIDSKYNYPLPGVNSLIVIIIQK